MTIYRPTSDVSAPGWSSTAGTLAAAINETTADDASYITSPDVAAPTPYRFNLGPLPSGEHTIRVRARRVGTAGEARLVLLDSGAAEVGASDWQALTDTWATYPLTAVASAVATMGEVQVRSAAVAWTPAALFASGEQGVWYDPADLSSMRQIAAGTTGVTSAGQPVGFMFDLSKSAELGTNVVSNGDFSNGSTGWSISGAAVSITGGLAIWSAATANQRIVQSGLSTSVTYRVDFDVTSISAGGVYPLYGGVDVPAESVGSYTWYIQGANQIYIRSGGTGFTGSVDNVVCRQVAGNHTRQATAANRPFYQSGPDRLVFDGTDAHPITFPSSLGSNCTIAHAVPGVGASILTGQTIGTSYTINQTHAGFVIVNRALTPGETASLTAYLNAKAGV